MVVSPSKNSRADKKVIFYSEIQAVTSIIKNENLNREMQRIRSILL